MRHVVEFKMPKLFGKKKVEEPTIKEEVITEENLGKLSSTLLIG